jgi:hypothetical protein
MSEREASAAARGLHRERVQEPSLATATRTGGPARSAPARQGQERER